jgi:hypothetical protein
MVAVQVLDLSLLIPIVRSQIPNPSQSRLLAMVTVMVTLILKEGEISGITGVKTEAGQETAREETNSRRIKVTKKKFLIEIFMLKVFEK